MGTGIEIGALSVEQPDRPQHRQHERRRGHRGRPTRRPSARATSSRATSPTATAATASRIDGVGHILKDNSAQMNGGWGIYAAVGAIDRGGNYAAGNLEPQQCYNVVCDGRLRPGRARDLDRRQAADAQPQPQRAASPTAARDDVSLERELVFECRIDTSDPLAWEDCEYPHEILNLMPGLAHDRDPRHRPARRRPARLDAGALHVDLRAAAGERSARGHPRHRPGPRDLAPRRRSSRSTRTSPTSPSSARSTCSATSRAASRPPSTWPQGGFEWGLEETEVGPHTFYVRAIDFEGNVGEPTTYTWSLLGVATQLPARPRSGLDRLHAAGDADRPGDRRRDAEHDGGHRLRRQRGRRDLRVLASTSSRSCPASPPVTYAGLIAGDHTLRVIATAGEIAELEAAEYEWSIVDPIDSAPPETYLDRRPANNSSSTTFEFTGTDDLTPPELLIFECRIDSTNELDWQECVSPFNLLDLFTYEDIQMAPGHAHLRGARHRHRRERRSRARPTRTRTSRATSTRRRPPTRGR